MAKITKFIDTQATTPNKYKIDGQEATIVQDWGITVAGTKNKAEYFNEIQENLEYTVNTLYEEIDNKSYYIVDLKEYVEYGKEFDLKLRATINTTNTYSSAYIRFKTDDESEIIDYPIKIKKNGTYVDISVNELKANDLVQLQVVTIANEKIALIVNNDDRKIDKSSVVQEIGTSLTRVPSQDLITKEIAKNLGVEKYAGILNTSEEKIVGNAYYDTATKEMYICTQDTEIDYADSEFFTAFSNNALLGKLQNLIFERRTIADAKSFLTPNTKYISRLLNATIADKVLYISFIFKVGVVLTTGETLFTVPTSISMYPMHDSRLMENSEVIRIGVQSNTIIIDSAFNNESTPGYYRLCIPFEWK